MFACFGRPYSGLVFVVPLICLLQFTRGAARRTDHASGRERRSGGSGGRPRRPLGSSRDARFSFLSSASVFRSPVADQPRAAKFVTRLGLLPPCPCLSDGLFIDNFGRSTEVWEVEKTNQRRRRRARRRMGKGRGRTGGELLGEDGGERDVHSTARRCGGLLVVFVSTDKPAASDERTGRRRGGAGER
uniref:Uncharacterized protein n=1 Tax=Oryza rufipogon TaxID=4529 RepID=A0A0E0PA27_ORYRU